MSFLGESRFWSESKIYLTVVRTMVTVGSVIILTGIELVVLLISASTGGGCVMALYSICSSCSIGGRCRSMSHPGAMPAPQS